MPSADPVPKTVSVLARVEVGRAFCAQRRRRPAQRRHIEHVHLKARSDFVVDYRFVIFADDIRIPANGKSRKRAEKRWNVAYNDIAAFEFKWIALLGFAVSRSPLMNVPLLLFMSLMKIWGSVSAMEPAHGAQVTDLSSFFPDLCMLATENLGVEEAIPLARGCF